MTAAPAALRQSARASATIQNTARPGPLCRTVTRANSEIDPIASKPHPKRGQANHIAARLTLAHDFEKSPSDVTGFIAGRSFDSQYGTTRVYLVSTSSMTGPFGTLAPLFLNAVFWETYRGFGLSWIWIALGCCRAGVECGGGVLGRGARCGLCLRISDRVSNCPAKHCGLPGRHHGGLASGASVPIAARPLKSEQDGKPQRAEP